MILIDRNDIQIAEIESEHNVLITIAEYRVLFLVIDDQNNIFEINQEQAKHLLATNWKKIENVIKNERNSKN